MVAVGVLAALINVGLVITVYVVDRTVEHNVRAFAASRLCRFRRAPVIHDSDIWLPNLPRSLFKYRKYPGMYPFSCVLRHT